MGGVEFVVPVSRKEIFLQRIKKNFYAYVGEGGMFQDLFFWISPSLRELRFEHWLIKPILNSNERKKKKKKDIHDDLKLH